MKYFKIILRSLLLLSFTNCSEENPIESNSNKYIGNWIWQKTVGGIFPRVITPESGVTIKIGFNNNDKYELYWNDTLKVKSEYVIEEREDDWDIITFSNMETYYYYSDDKLNYGEITSDTLLIWDGEIDGFFSTYYKQK